MKKFFIGLLAVMFVAGAAYAGAPDMDFSGMINTRGQYFSNDDGVTEDAGNYMIYDMEFDADLTIKPTDRNGVFINFEIHDESWLEPSNDSNGKTGDDQIAFKRAFGFHTFDAGGKLEFGILTGGAWAYGFGDNANGAYRVKYTHPMPFGPLVFVLHKLYEEGPAATDDFDAEADDSDLYAIATVTKAGDINIKPLFVYIAAGHIEADEETDQTKVVFDLGVDGDLGALGFEAEFVYQNITWELDSDPEDYSTIGLYANVWTTMDAMKVGGQVAYGSWDEDAGNGFGFGEDYTPTIGGADGFTIGTSSLSEYMAVTLVQAYLDFALNDEMNLGGSLTYWMSNEKDTVWEDATGYELDVTFGWKLADNVKYSVALGQGQIDPDDDSLDPDPFTRLYHKIQLSF